jgi:hypothetical protein
VLRREEEKEDEEVQMGFLPKRLSIDVPHGRSCNRRSLLQKRSAAGEVGDVCGMRSATAKAILRNSKLQRVEGLEL